MKNILITGAAGFVGSHVFDLLVDRFPESTITVVDKMTYAASHMNIPLCFEDDVKYNLIVGDLSDQQFTMDIVKGKDLVVHLAAESHVSRSFDNSLQFSKSNVIGTHTLIEACRIHGVKRIIHVSTDEVYGEKAYGCFNETDALSPTNPYSATKAAGDMIINSYIKSFSTPVVTVRANNIYGTRQYPEKIIPRFVLRALNGMPLTLHGDGSNLRHYLSAIDFAEAIYVLIKKGEVGQIYNIASDQEFSNRDIADMITAGVGDQSLKIIQVNDRPFNDSRYAVDDTKIRNLGWSCSGNLEEDLPKLIDWYSDNYGRWNSSVWRD
ncbi:GDP-mannose 4,6-dehydratase [Alphaproteobacteria bacterium]|nr:GDP-mannose 4,6-dehydratase [Alphaproteobacteria bacterium]